MKFARSVLNAWLYLWFLVARSAEACSVCFGDPDSAMTHGVKLAVLFLLGVVLFVLGGIAAVTVTWIRRAQKIQSENPNFSLKNR